MLTLLLADAELERVPAPLTGHLQVQESARRFRVNPARMLLDSSLHYAAMRSLQEGQRRGRPDLVHLFLLTALESIANKAGQLRVLVHTRDDRLIRIRSDTRLQRNYNRFCGLVEQLFETGRVPVEGDALLTMENGWTLEKAHADQRADRTLVLDPGGTRVDAWDVFTPQDATPNAVALIGGFPSGDYRSRLPEGERMSLGPLPLTVWSVASELLVNYERAARLRLPG